MSMVHASLWADEVATWSAAARGWGGLGRLVHHQDAVFGLYYAAMHLWIAVAGTSPLALRIPSAVAAVATLVVTARLARRLTGSAVAGAAASGFLAVDPYFVFYGANARPYAVLALLSAWTTDLVTQNEAPTRRTLATYTAVCCVGVYLHLFFGLLVLAQVLALSIWNRIRARHFLVCWTAIAVSAVPLVVVATSQRAQISWIPEANLSEYHTWWTHLVGRGGMPEVVFAGLSVLGLTVGGVPRSVRGLLAASATFGSLALVTMSWWWPSYDSRYVIESTPAIAVLVAIGLLQLTRWVAKPPSRTRLAQAGTRVFVGAVLLLCLTAGVVNAARTWSQQRQPFFYENLAAAAEGLRDVSTSGTGVLFLPAEARGSLYYYLDKDQDGDLGLVDLTAAHDVTPDAAGNFSGSNRSLAQAVIAARSFQQLVLVELGALPLAQSRQLAASLLGSHEIGRQHFGGMTLVLLSRR
jgi:mannosyltransferase